MNLDLDTGRLLVFLTGFGFFLTLESLLPARQLPGAKLKRLLTHGVMASVNTVLVRTLTFVPMLAWLVYVEQQGWGLARWLGLSGWLELSSRLLFWMLSIIFGIAPIIASRFYGDFIKPTTLTPRSTYRPPCAFILESYCCRASPKQPGLSFGGRRPLPGFCLRCWLAGSLRPIMPTGTCLTRSSVLSDASGSPRVFTRPIT